MAKPHDVVIIGAGHNGLTAACYLARAGLKPLVLERRDIVGGSSVTEEIHPGFRCSTLAHAAGPLISHILQDLHLERQGIEKITPEVRTTALFLDGPPLTIYNDRARTAIELQQLSAKEANSYAEFAATFSRLGKVIAPSLNMTPPKLDKPAPGEMWNLGKLGLTFRKLSRKDRFRLLRWLPMAVADLVGEWFETELLRATIAARGIFGAFTGPWSAGTSIGLLWQAALDGHTVAPASFVRGGMGALTQALAKAALAAGAEIRTGVSVERVQANEAAGPTVHLRDGEEIAARAVVSNADPRTTFLTLVDPLDLDPNFLLKIRNYRAVGTVAKINLALSDLPLFVGLNQKDVQLKLSGRIHIGPDIDYLERAFDAAKYGEYSPRPYLDVTLPSITDSSLAPRGAHVMSICVHFAPYKLRNGDWRSRSEEFGDSIINFMCDYAPNLKELIVNRQIITPLDLEQTYGLNGGHIFHGEQSLDQIFSFRPLIGWAQYRTPIKGLYLCGAGTHPGGGVTGGPGANASREIIKDMRSSRR